MSEIPFWVHDRPKWVSGIGKSTTCQDVLHSLVLAERKAANAGKPGLSLPKSSANNSGSLSRKESKGEDSSAREISKGLALVEQWRGVERPLSNSSRILKLWLAWGEERSQVRFVVKRISVSGGVSGVQTLGPSRPRSRPRRRNSRASATSDTKKADTLHPSALTKGSSRSSGDLEKLMRIILTQGETIHWQLKKLQEREGQIESIEDEVHQSRTKTAGKDYLLNAYLSQDQQSKTKKDSGVPNPGLETTTDGLQDILEALGKIFNLNEKITEAEEKVQDLESKLSVSQNPLLASASEIKSIQDDLKDLRTNNDQAGREIDHNRHLISSMRLAYDERKALMAQLEKDVDTIDKEGQRLQKELHDIQTKRQEQTFEYLSQYPIANDDLDESDDPESPIIFAGGFLDDPKAGHYDNNILTSEQLYEGPQEPGALYDELQRRLRIKTTHVGLEDIRGLSGSDTRIKATGSPGSNSSSGNSSGSGASYEKSVRFSDRQLILSTPELPELPPTLNAGLPTIPVDISNPQQQQHLNQKTKSILKPGDTANGPSNGNTNTDNTDSNSDTGLSSLHSSSDEGTYVLDTLV